MASALIFGLVWIPRWLFGRKRARHIPVRALPFAAILTLIAALWGAAMSIERIGELSFFPVLAFAGTIAFAVLSVASLWAALRAASRNEIHWGVRVHAVLVSVACCAITAFLGTWHLIGLRMWG
jgi:hypothetical protein